MIKREKVERVTILSVSLIMETIRFKCLDSTKGKNKLAGLILLMGVIETLKQRILKCQITNQL